MLATNYTVYTPATLCEVCENACGGCDWSRKGVQQPVEGWDAIRHDVNYGNDKKYRRRSGLVQESYIVFGCPEFVLEERNRWAFDRFNPEAIRRKYSRRRRRKNKEDADHA